MNETPTSPEQAYRQRIVCIGGAVFDRKYSARNALVPATSNPVRGFRSHGGVARNVAENLVRLGVAVSFISIVGADESGRSLLARLNELGADTSHVAVDETRPTAEYIAVLDPSNELALGLADMEIFDGFSPALLERAWPAFASADWVFADCNLPSETLAELIKRRAGAGFRLAIDAVSTPKVRKLPKNPSGVDLLFLNHDEADALLGIETARRGAVSDAAKRLIETGVDAVILTEGSAGYVVANGRAVDLMRPVAAQPIDITGAGDAMIAGTLYRLLSGVGIKEASRTGALLAALTTESAASVRPDLTADFLQSMATRTNA